MPNNYLSVLYQHIIQVENKNVVLKVEGHKHTIAPPVKKVGGHMPPLPPPASYASGLLGLTQLHLPLGVKQLHRSWNIDYWESNSYVSY